MKTLLLVLLLSLSSLSFAVEDYYPLDAPENKELFLAIAIGDFEKAKKLLEAGVNPNAKSVYGATAIHALTITDDEQGSIEFLPILLEYGTNIDAQDDDGDTGLVLAILKGRYELLYSLLQKGADIKIQNNNGLTILHTIAGLSDSSAFLTIDQPFNQPYLKKSFDFILSQTDQEFIDIAGSEARITPLHMAVSTLNVAFITALAEKASLNNKPDVYGLTPILIALIHLNNMIFHLLETSQKISPDTALEMQRISVISSTLLKSLKPEDLDKEVENGSERFISANILLSDIEQNLNYIKDHQNEVPQFAFFYNYFRPITDFINESKTDSAK